MHQFHIPEYSIQNTNVHILVLNGAFWDIEQVHSGICESSLLTAWLLYWGDVVFFTIVPWWNQRFSTKTLSHTHRWSAICYFWKPFLCIVNDSVMIFVSRLRVEIDYDIDYFKRKFVCIIFYLCLIRWCKIAANPVFYSIARTTLHNTYVISPISPPHTFASTYHSNSWKRQKNNINHMVYGTTN